ncbi:L,D-transpeptidase family protein [bacterium]
MKILLIVFYILVLLSTAFSIQDISSDNASFASFENAVLKLKSFKNYDSNPCIIIAVALQKLFLFEDDNIIAEYYISSSKYGIGSEEGSMKTPLGAHAIYKKIGSDAPIGTMFKARKQINKISKIYTEPVSTKQDIITTRILWLKGLEQGINKGKNIDSKKRYIYIHGTHEEGLIGKPASKGCIRMKNKDVIELFDKAGVNTLVEIIEK